MDEQNIINLVSSDSEQDGDENKREDLKRKRDSEDIDSSSGESKKKRRKLNSESPTQEEGESDSSSSSSASSSSSDQLVSDESPHNFSASGLMSVERVLNFDSSTGLTTDEAPRLGLTTDEEEKGEQRNEFDLDRIRLPSISGKQKRKKRKKKKKKKKKKRRLKRLDSESSEDEDEELLFDEEEPKRRIGGSSSSYSGEEKEKKPLPIESFIVSDDDVERLEEKVTSSVPQDYIQVNYEKTLKKRKEEEEEKLKDLAMLHLGLDEESSDGGGGHVVALDSDSGEEVPEEVLRKKRRESLKQLNIENFLPAKVEESPEYSKAAASFKRGDETLMVATIQYLAGCFVDPDFISRLNERVNEKEFSYYQEGLAYVCDELRISSNQTIVEGTKEGVGWMEGFVNDLRSYSEMEDRLLTSRGEKKCEGCTRGNPAHFQITFSGDYHEKLVVIEYDDQAEKVVFYDAAKVRVFDENNPTQLTNNNLPPPLSRSYAVDEPCLEVFRDLHENYHFLYSLSIEIKTKLEEIVMDSFETLSKKAKIDLLLKDREFFDRRFAQFKRIAARGKTKTKRKKKKKKKKRKRKKRTLPGLGLGKKNIEVIEID